MTRSRAYYRVTETDRISVKVYLYSTGSGLFFDQTRGWVELTVIVFGIDSSLSDDQVRSACSSISNGYVSSIKTDIQRGTETKCAVAALFCKDYVIENGTRKYVSDWYPCGICFSLSFFPYKQDLLFGLLRFRLSMYQVKLRIISPHLRASINN